LFGEEGERVLFNEEVYEERGTKSSRRGYVEDNILLEKKASFVTRRKLNSRASLEAGKEQFRYGGERFWRGRERLPALEPGEPLPNRGGDKKSPEHRVNKNPKK